MAQPRCFTLRLPQELYIELYDIATSQKKTLNATVIDLIKIAMTNKVSVRSALEELLNREFGVNAITSES